MVNDVPVAVLPTPTPVKLQNINWEVIIKSEGEDGLVYFALTPGDYEKLALNMAEMLRWNQEMRWHLRYYINEVSENGDKRGRSTTNSEGDSQ